MTDLQLKYWQLEEDKRANRATEALKDKDVSSQIMLREDQRLKLQQEVVNLEHEIDLIDARTDLTQQQKQEALSKTVGNWTDNVISWLDPFGILRGFGQGLSKGVGQTVGGGLFS